MTLSIVAIIISVIGLLAISIVFAQVIICELHMRIRIRKLEEEIDKMKGDNRNAS